MSGSRDIDRDIKTKYTGFLATSYKKRKAGILLKKNGLPSLNPMTLPIMISGLKTVLDGYGLSQSKLKPSEKDPAFSSSISIELLAFGRALNDAANALALLQDLLDREKDFLIRKNRLENNPSKAFTPEDVHAAFQATLEGSPAHQARMVLTPAIQQLQPAQLVMRESYTLPASYDSSSFDLLFNDLEFFIKQAKNFKDQNRLNHYQAILDQLCGPDWAAARGSDAKEKILAQYKKSKKKIDLPALQRLVQLNRLFLATYNPNNTMTLNLAYGFEDDRSPGLVALKKHLVEFRKQAESALGTEGLDPARRANEAEKAAYYDRLLGALERRSELTVEEQAAQDQREAELQDIKKGMAKLSLDLERAKATAAKPYHDFLDALRAIKLDAISGVSGLKELLALVQPLALADAESDDNPVPASLTYPVELQAPRSIIFREEDFVPRQERDASGQRMIPVKKPLDGALGANLEALKDQLNERADLPRLTVFPYGFSNLSLALPKPTDSAVEAPAGVLAEPAPAPVYENLDAVKARISALFEQHVPDLADPVRQEKLEKEVDARGRWARWTTSAKDYQSAIAKDRKIRAEFVAYIQEFLNDQKTARGFRAEYTRPQGMEKTGFLAYLTACEVAFNHYKRPSVLKEQMGEFLKALQAAELTRIQKPMPAPVVEDLPAAPARRRQVKFLAPSALPGAVRDPEADRHFVEGGSHEEPRSSDLSVKHLVPSETWIIPGAWGARERLKDLKAKGVRDPNRLSRLDGVAALPGVTRAVHARGRRAQGSDETRFDTLSPVEIFERRQPKDKKGKPLDMSVSQALVTLGLGLDAYNLSNKAALDKIYPATEVQDALRLYKTASALANAQNTTQADFESFKRDVARVEKQASPKGPLKVLCQKFREEANKTSPENLLKNNNQPAQNPLAQANQPLLKNFKLALERYLDGRDCQFGLDANHGRVVGTFDYQTAKKNFIKWDAWYFREKVTTQNVQVAIELINLVNAATAADHVLTQADVESIKTQFAQVAKRGSLRKLVTEFNAQSSALVLAPAAPAVAERRRSSVVEIADLESLAPAPVPV